MKNKILFMIFLPLIFASGFIISQETDRGVKLKTQDINPDLHDHLALVIGIDQYKNITDLKNAVFGAREVKKILIEKYGYYASNIYELYNLDANKQNIDSKLRLFADNKIESDSLLIYFSGHGYFDQSFNTGYWLPSDVGDDLQNREKSLSDAEIANRSAYKIGNFQIQGMMKNCKAKHIFVIADSCYSASLLLGKNWNNTSIKGVELPIAFKYKSRHVLASARTIAPDGEPGNHSPFTENLLKFLKNNEEEYFTGSRVIDHLKTTKISPAPVGGHAEDVGHDDGEFFFVCIGVKNIPEKLTFQKYKELHEKNPDPNFLKKLNDKLRSTEKNLPPIPEDYLRSLTQNTKGYYEMNFNNGHKMIYIPEKNFWVDKYEVSFGQLENLKIFQKKRKRSNIKYIRKLSEKHPAIVSYTEAMEYCGQIGLELLSKDEWEFIAGKTQGNIYSWGNEKVDAGEVYRANYDSTDNKDGFRELARINDFEKYASPYGIVNLSGNAWEWVGGKICKGGGFMSKEQKLLIEYTSTTQESAGFRCVKKGFLK